VGDYRLFRQGVLDLAELAASGVEALDGAGGGDFCNQETKYNAYSSDRPWRSIGRVNADRAGKK
jgi:hypothetical protein